MDGMGLGWIGWMDLRVGGGIEHLTVLIKDDLNVGCLKYQDVKKESATVRPR